MEKKSSRLTKKEEIELAYEELEEQRDLECRELEDQAYDQLLDKEYEQGYGMPVFYSYEEYLEYLEEEEEKKAQAIEAEKRRFAEEIVRQKETAIFEKILEVKGLYCEKYHIETRDESCYFVPGRSCASFPKGYLSFLSESEHESYTPIGLFDLTEYRCFIFDSDQQNPVRPLREGERLSICLTDSNGLLILRLSINTNILPKAKRAINGWHFIVFGKSLRVLVNDEGESVFVFPNEDCRITDKGDDSTVLSYPMRRSIGVDKSFIVDFNKKKIVLKQWLPYSSYSESPRFETHYLKTNEIITNSLFIGQNKNVFPQQVYSSLDSFVSQNWLVAHGKFRRGYDVFHFVKSCWRIEDLLKAVVNHQYSIQHVECDDLTWFEKKYGDSRRRYPLLQYYSSSGTLNIIIGGKRICLPFNKYSIAFVYRYLSTKSRISWTRPLHSQKDVFLEDFGAVESEIAFLVLCGGNLIINTDGSLYHRFSPDATFVDSWFEYLAFAKNNQTTIYRFIQGRQLSYIFDDEALDSRVISPQYGSITGVIDYETFQQRIWGLENKGTTLMAIDSNGENHPITVSKQFGKFNITENQSNCLVLVLGNGGYAFIHENEQVIIEKPCSIYTPDKTQDLPESDKRRYLDIGSRYECFDNHNQVFVPVPWINKVLKEDHEREIERQLDNPPEEYSILEALEGDWSYYWNID